MTIEYSILEDNEASTGTNGIKLETNDEWDSDVPRHAPIETDRYVKILHCEFKQDARMRDFSAIYGGYLHIAINSHLDLQDSFPENFNVPQVLIYNSSFVNGLARKGGAIYSNGFTNLELRGCYFDYNRAYEEGGAIYVFSIYKQRVLIDGSEHTSANFLYNIAGQMGSNIFTTDVGSTEGYY